MKHDLKPLLLAVLFVPLSAQAATSIPFTVNMSEAANVTGCPATCPRIAVDVGGVTRYAAYSAGSGTSTLTFTYDMVAGDVDLDGVTVSSPVDLNGGSVTDLNGNAISDLTFTPPNTANVKVNYPSLGMDFVQDADGRYTLNGTVYNDLSSFLTATGGTFSRNSVGTYYDSTGTLQTATAHTPRFDHDPITHAAKGILIEEGRANLETYSSDLTNGVWYKNNTSITANATMAPDGTVTAGKVVESTANTVHVLSRWIQVAVSPGVVTASIFVKSGERQVHTVFLSSGTSAAYARLDSSYNVTSAGLWWGTEISSISAKSQNCGNGWYRVSVTGTTTAATAGVGLYLHSGGAYVGDGVSGAYAWGAQVEQGAFPTTYIPTTNAAVTRQADIMTVPTGAWYNQSAGTIYGYGTSVAMGVDHRIATVRKGSSDYYGLRITSGNLAQLVAYDSGGVLRSVTPGGTVLGGDIRMVAAQKVNDLAVAYNGGSLASSAVWLPVTASYLAIGYDGVALASGYAFMNGYIRQFKYYPLRVSDTQLQLLTQ